MSKTHPMAHHTTVKEVFETAVRFEKTAYEFYTALAPRVSKSIRYLVEELAQEELEHVELFSKLAEDPDVARIMAEEIDEPVANRKFSDCVQTPDLGENPDDQAVLQYALMRETAAMEEYAELARSTPKGHLKDAFLFLANEEAKHKAELEAIYYDLVHSGRRRHGP